MEETGETGIASAPLSRVFPSPMSALPSVALPLKNPRSPQIHPAMGYWQAALVKVGVAQPGPRITSHDRAILEYVSFA